MKFKVLFFFLFFVGTIYSQSELYYFKDSSSSLNYKKVKEKEFKPLLKNQILEKHSNDIYWILIPAIKTKSKYIIRITYDRFRNANAYQNSNKIEKLVNQRYLSFKFTRDFDVYIQINPKLDSYIPIEIETEENSILKEYNLLLLNGFYYGFVILIIIYNLFYYALFKDDSFLYYALFLASMSFGVFTLDGMLNFYNIGENLNDFLMVMTYISIAFFSSKFVNSYLFLDYYYPKLNKFGYALGSLIILIGILYFTYKTYYYLLFLNILLFSLLFMYWFITVLLFNKNVYTKILAIAYVIILFSAIDYYILRFFGVSFLKINPIIIKMGSFFEMILLSIAVLYRMKVLKDENSYMRNEIVNYSEQLSNLTSIESKNNKFSTEELSQREREIFTLIVSGKSNKEIAAEVNISVNTVKFHVKNIYGKLNIKSRKEVLEI